ncbi:uncharacterized protein TRAVEDRAFT_67072 [Trametes versicolor FP-101664 SS1]|uniref:uncharacterized protein n=1 Tax=Trametes versicolor (strain FP-101664) TaxID=717944 RepID=UPI00046243F0|nr:uncharacterized protein TRAVEDRAFT_67072 [Trametes versicolor FP-101664 SS1]EIW53644.1 hypothetical protein TRAVEDRAFT_67072 [Trametes versicolor FP-101664 SS1]
MNVASRPAEFGPPWQPADDTLVSLPEHSARTLLARRELWLALCRFVPAANRIAIFGYAHARVTADINAAPDAPNPIASVVARETRGPLTSALRRNTPLSLRSADAPPTQSVALSLVRAAHSLSCDVVLKLARRRLCAIWVPPKASTRPASLGAPSKTSPSSSSSGVDTDTKTVHTYHNAVFIILFARQYGIPELLKRAFYGLLASAEFWAALTADRKQIRLTEADLLRLYNARHVLQQRWRETVVLAPYMDEKGVSTCRGDGSQHWRKMMLESEVVEAGMGDPLRYDASSGLTKEHEETWGRGCRKGWTDMLARKRTEWWASFGDLMQLATLKPNTLASWRASARMAGSTAAATPSDVVFASAG